MQTIFRDFIKTDKSIYIQMSNIFYGSDAVDHIVPQKCFECTFDRCCTKNDPYVRGLIIEYGGEVAGYALLSFTYSNEVGGMVLLVEEAYINPDFRGKGIISKFFAFLESEYSGKIKRYRLEVTENNRHAIEIYEHFGYKKLEYVQMIRDL